MNQIRYIFSFLLVAASVCAYAQPIVKINPGTTSECDVNPTPGGPIFQLDTVGNVLVNGSFGTGCANQGGSSKATFGFNPPASGVVINGGSTTVAAGSPAVPFTYQAYQAAGGCTVGTPTTSGSCPAITASNGSCSGTGTYYSCAPTGATLSIPASVSASCNYLVTATCSPGSVTSSATLTVSPVSGGGDCPGLATMHTSSGAPWSRLTANTSVKFGDGTVATNIDPKDYVAVWSYPGTGSVPWPGSAGLSTRPNVGANQYVAEAFVVPSDTSLAPKWSWTGSGINSNFSLTIGTCPGDFGQTGSQLTTGCKLNQSNSSNGLTAHVNPTQQGTACTLTPGLTYYLNILPDANLPVSDVTTPSPACTTCTPWAVRN